MVCDITGATVVISACYNNRTQMCMHFSNIRIGLPSFPFVLIGTCFVGRISEY